MQVSEAAIYSRRPAEKGGRLDVMRRSAPERATTCRRPRPRSADAGTLCRDMLSCFTMSRSAETRL